ncbi:DUF2238 domain-containing protein [Thermoproteota archaeon]
MLIKKNQLPILLTVSIALVFFANVFFLKQNYEFMVYIGVTLFFVLLVIFTNWKVHYPNRILWGLTVWAILHLAGGGLSFDGIRCYELMLINLIGEPYHILRYDQFVHAFGFFIATLTMYHLLKPMIKEKTRWIAMSIVIISAGLGAGALNEIIEFTTTIFIQNTGVGDYINTSLDLVSDLVGAVLGMIYIRYRHNKEFT